MKPIFRGLTIAVVGDLGGNPSWTDTNITRWVELRKGRFVREMSDDVTHVLCSKEEFKRMGPMVKEALKCKTCEIVTPDWLDFSTQSNKRLDETRYSHLRALKKARERERKRKLRIEGLKKAEREVDPSLYHPYTDRTFFQYTVELTRDNEETGRTERYVLTLHESNNTKPHDYWFVAKLYKRKHDSRPNVYRPSQSPGTFAREFGFFEFFFNIRTGIPWAQRLVATSPENTKKVLFQYKPPTGGKPVGWVPEKFTPVEVSDAAMEAEAAAVETGASL